MVCSVSKCKLSKRLKVTLGSSEWDAFILSLTGKRSTENTVIEQNQTNKQNNNNNTNLTPHNL